MLLPRQPPFRKRRESKSEKRVTSLYLINMLPLFREKHVYFSNARFMTLFLFPQGRIHPCCNDSTYSYSFL